MRESFILYTDIIKHVERLTLEQRGSLFTAILMYEFDGDLPEMDSVTEMCFSFIQASLDREAKKYDAKIEKRRAAAEARWMQEHANDANASDALQTDANDGVPVPAPLPAPAPAPSPVPSKNNKRFVPPTLDEVKDYIWEKGYHFDAESFLAFYESNGWKVGRNPMKSWKAACATWEGRRKEEDKQKKNENDDLDEWLKHAEEKENEQNGLHFVF